MPAPGQIGQTGEVKGTAWRFGQVTVTPMSRYVRLSWPAAGRATGPVGGIVWNRATALLVDDGERSWRLAVVDTSRRLRWGLLGLASLFAGMALWPRLRQERKKQDG